MKNKTTILVMLILAVALVAVMAVISSRQDLRRSAHYAKGSLYLTPTDNEVRVGDDINLILKAVPGPDSPKIQNVQAFICYNKSILTLGDDTVDASGNYVNDGSLANIRVINKNVFLEEPIVFFEDIAAKRCLNLTVVSNRASELTSEVVDVASIKFTAIGEGNGAVEIVKADSVMSGYIADNLDKSIEITNVENANYLVRAAQEEPLVGEVPWLNFKMAFMGVNSESSCAVNWPMTLTVLGGGVTRVYSNVKGTVVSGTEGPVVYNVSLPLTGFNQTEKVAVLIKGPKHLQVKYAVDGQKGFYGAAGGELTLAKDKAASKVYDFTGYPLLAGDVTGKNGIQDGLINGLDFLFVRDKAIARARDLQNMDMADLDGNCVHNSLDITWLMQSLAERQEQMN